MRETLTLGPTPADEDCAQVGEDGYGIKALAESRAWIGQLRRVFGPEPEGARLTVASFPHDLGSYHEVVVRYDPKNTVATAWAYKAENNAPTKWDDEAKKELSL